MPVAIVEHLDRWSPWLDLEYMEAYRTARKHDWEFTVTNADPEVLAKAKYPALPYSASELPLRGDRVIVLDPDAEDPLTPEDDPDVVIVGGILGDYPRRHRTRKELTPRFPDAEVRHLGPYHFSIDGALKVALTVLECGVPLEEIQVVERPEIEVAPGHTVRLDCDYPSENGKPTLPEGLVEYLREGIVDYEEAELSARRRWRHRNDGSEGDP
ncbi:hypothetical protein [Methanopyrus sp.]